MRTARIILTIILLIACIVLMVFAFLGDTEARKWAIVFGCGTAIVNTVFFARKDRKE